MLLMAQDAMGQVRRYRIELLVLTHLNPPDDVVPETAITDYSGSLDLLNPPPVETTDGEETVAEILPSSLPDQAGDTGSPASEAQELLPGDAPEPMEDPNAVVWLETPSDTMDQAWRRLRSSNSFRPEVYFSWEQSNQQPFPVLRVHDATVLFEEDPFAGLRLAAETSPPVVPDSGEDAPAELLPEPLRFYRIDGTASLRKTRYLHLDLDLQLRIPARAADAGPEDPELSRSSTWDIFPIQQSRRIQTQNVEYFDGPVIGVLALVSRIDATPDDEPADEVGPEVPAGDLSEDDLELSD